MKKRIKDESTYVADLCYYEKTPIQIIENFTTKNWVFR